jgi:hypothetical protein
MSNKKNFTNFRQVAAEFSRTDGQNDRHEEANSLHTSCNWVSRQIICKIHTKILHSRGFQPAARDHISNFYTYIHPYMYTTEAPYNLCYVRLC